MVMQVHAPTATATLAIFIALAMILCCCYGMCRRWCPRRQSRSQHTPLQGMQQVQPQNMFHHPGGMYGRFLADSGSSGNILALTHGQGQTAAYGNPAFNGQLPPQRSFRDNILRRFTLQRAPVQQTQATSEQQSQNASNFDPTAPQPGDC